MTVLERAARARRSVRVVTQRDWRQWVTVPGSPELRGGQAEGSTRPPPPGGYPAVRGARLRALRRQRHLSLQDVEAASDHEFKASVLGAYERGERAISVLRLRRLARVYRVPVDRVVPSDEPGLAPPAGVEQVVDLTAGMGDTQHDDRLVTIDLSALAQLGGQEGAMLARYVRTIEVQRGDYNGRVLTVRCHDLTAIACIFGCHPDGVRARLDDLGLRPVP
jgi:transcriptional regulator with XRE-family HTH domain